MTQENVAEIDDVIADIIIGAHGADVANVGQRYVMFGSNRGFTSAIDQTDLSGVNAAFKKYADNAGKELTTRFANGYEVSELTAEIEKNHFYQYMRPLVEPISESDEKFPEFFLALKSFIAGLSSDSPAKIFAASAEVTSEISGLEIYKDRPGYCERGEDIISTKEACATIPFLAKACDHLAALQSELGSVPVCGEDSPAHTDL